MIRRDRRAAVKAAVENSCALEPKNHSGWLKDVGTYEATLRGEGESS